MSFTDQQIVSALQVIDLLRETTGFGSLKAKYHQVLIDAEKELVDKAQAEKDAIAAKEKAEHEAMLAQVDKEADSPPPPKPSEPLPSPKSDTPRPSDAFRRA